MNPILIAVTLATLVALSTIIGLLWQRGQGRVRRTAGVILVSAADLGIDSLASGATLVQFSTRLCSPCKAAHGVLETAAGERDGVDHVDIDLEARPELAGHFNILQTPTTFILDRNGTIRARIGGALRRDAVIAELDRILAAA